MLGYTPHQTHVEGGRVHEGEPDDAGNVSMRKGGDLRFETRHGWVDVDKSRAMMYSQRHIRWLNQSNLPISITNIYPSNAIFKGVLMKFLNGC